MVVCNARSGMWPFFVHVDGCWADEASCKKTRQPAVFPLGYIACPASKWTAIFLLCFLVCCILCICCVVVVWYYRVFEKSALLLPRTKVWFIYLQCWFLYTYFSAQNFFIVTSKLELVFLWIFYWKDSIYTVVLV